MKSAAYKKNTMSSYSGQTKVGLLEMMQPFSAWWGCQYLVCLGEKDRLPYYPAHTPVWSV